jgi:acetylornithine/succinyldiaminopimelate/putrescine aminotransferase
VSCPNVREREAQIRATCIVGPVQKIQGRGLMLGLVCDLPAVDVQKALLERDILAGTSSDPAVLRLLPPLVLESGHVERLAAALAGMGTRRTASSSLQTGIAQ